MAKIMLPNMLCGTSHNYYVALRPYQAQTFMAHMRTQQPSDKWRFGFSNAVDSTWDDGSYSHADLLGSEFEIVSAAFSNGDEIAPITFGGKPGINVVPGEIIQSDICHITANGAITFRWCVKAGPNGAKIPATPDTQVACGFADGDKTFAADNEFSDAQTLEPANLCALPDLFEAECDARPRMIFIGDSITQGVGTTFDMYDSWAARIAYKLRNKYAALNIGLGYAQIKDAARDGAWLKRAKAGDVINICLGVNDILHGDSDSNICIERIRRIISLIKSAPGERKVVLFTVPPFDYEGANIATWREINAAIRSDGHLGADRSFAMADILSAGGDADYMSKYGSHPDGIGGAAVADEYVNNFEPTL